MSGEAMMQSPAAHHLGWIGAFGQSRPAYNGLVRTCVSLRVIYEPLCVVNDMPQNVPRCVGAWGQGG